MLDTAPEERFDRLTRLAQDMFHAPRTWLADEVDSGSSPIRGRRARDHPADVAFCAHAILDDQVFVIPDAKATTSPTSLSSRATRTSASTRERPCPRRTDTPSGRSASSTPSHATGPTSSHEPCATSPTWSRKRGGLNQTRLQNQQRALLRPHRRHRTHERPSRQLRRALAIGYDYLGRRGSGQPRRREAARCSCRCHPAGTSLTASGCHCRARSAASRSTPTTSSPSTASRTRYATRVSEQELSAALLTSEDAHRRRWRALCLLPAGTNRSPFHRCRPGLRPDHGPLGGSHAATLRTSTAAHGAARIAGVITRAQSSFIQTDDRMAALDGLLQDVLGLTGCEYGFVGEVLHRPDGAPYLKTHAVTDIAWNDDTRLVREAQGRGPRVRQPGHALRPHPHHR